MTTLQNEFNLSYIANDTVNNVETIQNDLVSNDLQTVESDRALASIVRVAKLYPIVGADLIVLAQIKGWKCIVKINDFTEGDLGVYFEIDSVVDKDDPTFVFLKGKYRIKTMKMRGVLSQGLLLPLSCLATRGHDISGLIEGMNVTEQMGVQKYIETEEMGQYIGKSGQPRNPFPNFCQKTDEPRIQNNTNFFNMLKGRLIVITRKEDGSSGTFSFKDGIFGIHSRNTTLDEQDASNMHYFFVKDKFEIDRKMTELGLNIAIQGEVIGPKINGNRMKLTEYDYRVFNIYDIDNQVYFDWSTVLNITSKLGLHTVPVIFEGYADELELTVDAFLELAKKQMYVLNKDPKKCILAEGIVVKTIDDGPRISFKVVSNEYLLKHDL